MDFVLEYKITNVDTDKIKDLLEDKLKQWLKSNDYDVVVSSFEFDEDYSINIDCYFNKDKIENVKASSELFFNRLDVQYSLSI